MKMRLVLQFGMILAGLCASDSLLVNDSAKPLNYEENIKPVLKQHCFKCHGEDEKKDGLSLATYADVMKGGSSGDIVKAGRPAGSPLYLAVAHEGNDTPPMPPKQPKISEAEIGLVKRWIEQGVIENSGGKSKAPVLRNVEFKAEIGKSDGPPPMPENLPAVKLPELKRANAITALAASPKAPLVAVAGYERITLYDTDKRAVLGVLPFPEGVPQVLRFSRNGTVLLAAGGRGVKLGKAVLYDVKSGNRLGDFGDETDEVRAADISPDQKLVAIGGPTKNVKVFSTKDGKLLYKITKHTDWITAIEFSPDGKKLATADRNGGVHLWEPETGGIILSLSEHKDGVNSMSWRGDSEILATGGEDGQLIIWDAREGWPVNSSSPHSPKKKGAALAKIPDGVLSLQFANDGNLFSVGRDNSLRAWTSSGGKIGAYENLSAPPTRVAATYDGKYAIVGDLKGNVWIWEAPGGKEIQPLIAGK